MKKITADMILNKYPLEGWSRGEDSTFIHDYGPKLYDHRVVSSRKMNLSVYTSGVWILKIDGEGFELEECGTDLGRSIQEFITNKEYYIRERNKSEAKGKLLSILTDD